METPVSQLPARTGSATDDWVKIVSHLARGAGLTTDDVRRLLNALKNSDEIRTVESALRQWLVQQVDTGGPIRAQVQLAALPPTARPAAELVVAHDPFDPHSESIRALRSELLLRQDPEQCNLIAVVSPGAGEGRSRLAAELAISCAQLGQPSLLVDADLRRPRQHVLFEAQNESGLAHALDNGSAPQLQGVDSLPTLNLLTAGFVPRNPLELLSRPGFGALLDGWARQYRHIIIDTPPVSLVSDALAVAMHCRCVLVVTRAQHSLLGASREMLRRLATTQARVLGSVVNHF